MGCGRQAVRVVAVAAILTVLTACGEPGGRSSDGTGDSTATPHIDGWSQGVLLAGDTAIWPKWSGSTAILADDENAPETPLVTIDLGDEVAYVAASPRGDVVDVVALTCATPNPEHGMGDVDPYCNGGARLHHVEVTVDGWLAGDPTVLVRREEVPWSIGTVDGQPVVVTGGAVYRRDGAGEWATIPGGGEADREKLGEVCPTAMGLVAVWRDHLNATTIPFDEMYTAPIPLRLLPPGSDVWQDLPVPSARGIVGGLICWSDGFVLSTAVAGPRGSLWFVSGTADQLAVREFALPGVGGMHSRSLGDGELLGVLGMPVGADWATFVFEPTGELVLTERIPRPISDEQIPESGAFYGRRNGEVVRISRFADRGALRVEALAGS